MANNTVHTITLSGYTATAEGNCWALQLGTWDSYGIEQIQLKLGQEWAGLVITATFTPPKGRKAVKVVVDSSGLFSVPQEATALSGQGTITFAGNTSGQQRISVDVPYVVANHAAVDGVTPDPTPSEWAQFVAQVQQARDDAEAAAQAAEGSQTAAAGSASDAANSAAAAAGSAQKAKNLVDGAVQYITAAKNAAVKEVNTAGETAVQEVQKAQSTGVQAVQTAQTEGVKAIQTAQTEGVKAVNDAGNAKVEEIEQINALLPKPTEADAGKVPVAQPNGTYELGDAGNKIDDTAIAEDTTWSSRETASRIYQMREVSGAIVRIDDALPEFPMKVISESEVTRCGKNLFNAQTVQENTWVNPDTGETEGASGFWLSDYIPVVKGLTYYVSPKGSNRGVFYNSNKQYLEAWLGSTAYTDSFTASENGFLRISGTKSVDTIFVSVNEPLSPYEPYTGETFPAGTPIMPLDGVNTIFAASGGVAVGYASKVKAPINDAQITPLNTWSAQKLVDTLCPPFSVTGDVVQFNPVDGYPLSVQSTIVATQEGTGDPSPTNVRPIVPVNEAGIWWIDGDNVLNLNHVELGTFSTVNGEPTESATQYRTAYKVPCTKNSVLYQSNNKNLNVRVFVWNESGGFVASEAVVSGGSYTFTVDGYFAIVSGTSGFVADHYVGFSKTAAPYVGKDYTAPLPEPCYGGTVDLTGGTGEANRMGIVITGNEELIQSESEGRIYFLIIFPDLPLPKNGTGVEQAKKEQWCNLGTIGNPYSEDVDNCAWVYNTPTAQTTLRFRFSSLFNDTASAQAQLKAWYEAGTPLTVAYDIVTPTPFTFDPLSIPAPASPATAYSTAGEITVSGRSDPIEYINQQIANAIAIAKV